MPLTAPPSLSLKSLNAGYDGSVDFQKLKDSQTNDGLNVEIAANNIRKRNGYARMLKESLGGYPVKGHYQLVKSGVGGTISSHIVAAGPNLYSYTSSIANIIMSGLDNGNDNFWTFTQIMDPRDGSNDVVVGTNGVDQPIVWDGVENSAIHLDDVTFASGVTPAKYLVSCKNRLLLFNINDSTDVDAESKFIMSGFDSNGKPTPHVFPSDLQQYAGGSDIYGGITGAASFNGRVVVFKRNTTYIFTLGSDTVDEANNAIIHSLSLSQLNENIGCIAPRTICSVGDYVMFLSEYGVMAFDGRSFININGPISKDVKNTNNSRRTMASAVYNRADNQYWLSISSPGSTINDMVFVYDIPDKLWWTPFSGMKCNVMSNFKVNNEEKMLCGDDMGYIYELNKGTADGLYTGVRKLPAEAAAVGTSATRLTFYDLTTPTKDYFKGIYLRDEGDIIPSGKAVIMVSDVTGSKTEVEIDYPYNSNTQYTSTYFTIGAIESYFRTKDFDLQNPGYDKIWRQVQIRTEQPGNYTLGVNYIADFNDISRAGSASISMLQNNKLVWSYSSTNWTSATWGPAKPTVKKISMRNLITQPLVAKYMAFKFYNNNPNEPWEIYGLDIETKTCGRR